MAPEYANSGLLNEKSDVYSFGVVLLEAITGRDPVDYGRPAPEVCFIYMFLLYQNMFYKNEKFTKIRKKGKDRETQICKS